jgi:hypothetical protein
MSRIVAAVRLRAALAHLPLATAGALAAVVALTLVHASAHAEPVRLLPVARDTALALPFALAAVLLAATVGRRLGTGLGLGRAAATALETLVAAIAFAAAMLPAAELHVRLFVPAGQATDAWVEHAVAESALVLGSATAAFGLGYLVRAFGTIAPARLGLGALGLAAIAGGVVAAPAISNGTQGASLQAPPSACTAATAARTYDVSAMNVRLPFNRWGDALEHGMVYVLEGDRAAVKNWSVPLAANPAADPANNRRLRPRPLVLRANEGECVHVRFTNRLGGTQDRGIPANPRASMHVAGASYSAQTSDGGNVGYNDDTTVPNADDPATDVRENQIDYFWVAPKREGFFLIRDTATPAGGEADAGSQSQGLYGALVVEPAGSTWRDRETGKLLYQETGNQSGDLYVDAIISPPSGRAFRETVQISQDEIPSIGLGFNYGAEPERNRGARACPDCVSEETSLSSWAYGDPSLIKLASGIGPWLPDANDKNAENCGLSHCYVSNVFHTYPGDPTKLRFGHAGTKETHVFHLHAHQWLAEDRDVGAAGATPSAPDDEHMPESTTIDSQTFGPGETFTADLLFGAGSKGGTFGDAIFHCHLYPHFADGFWALMRTHDVFEGGASLLPDGVRVRSVAVLPDRAAPESPTATNPGYPRMIPGTPGWRAPQPPGSVTLGGPSGTAAPRIVAGEELTAADTAIERAVQAKYYGDAAKAPAGAPFKDPCPTSARSVNYDVSLMQWSSVQNKQGDYDPQARFLVLSRDVPAIIAGTKEPEPLFFRVNSGDCINFAMTNLSPNWVGGDAYLRIRQTNMAGQHVHLVKFDVTASDGASNGWNYQQAAFTDEQVRFNESVLAGTKACNDTPRGCTIPDLAYHDPLYKGVEPGQTIMQRWYADYELRTAFTHDHHFPAVDQNRGLYGALIVEPAGFDVRDPKTGDYYQPINDPKHGPVCGDTCAGESASTQVDVIGPKAADDFREFGLSFQDFVPSVKAGGDPHLPGDVWNAPATPGTLPLGDGVMTVNYKNAPFRYRESLNGAPVDPAYTFSSQVWGDPDTPLLRAYAGDPVRLRAIQGSQEEQHVIQIHGTRFKGESGDPGSPLVPSKAIGISEAFNIDFDAAGLDCALGDACQADYLYGSGATDDYYLGMWGLMRVHGREQNGLLPLPDYAVQPSPATAAASRLARAQRALSRALRKGARPASVRSNLGNARKTLRLVAKDVRAAKSPAFGPVGSKVNAALRVSRGKLQRAKLLRAKSLVTSARRALARAAAAPIAAPTVTGTPPARVTDPGNPCPEGAPTRSYDIVALNLDIAYNRYGDHDPRGLMYALADDVEALRAGAKKPEPLVIRANEGDCIEVQLSNEIDATWDDVNAGVGGDPPVPSELATGTRTGLRVSLHPQLVSYDVRGSDGATIGFNGDQTVGPGEPAIQYRWYADEVDAGELGMANLVDYGDVRGHRHHGLGGGLVIEPKGSTWHDPQTGEEIRSGAKADIRVAGAGDFRENVLFYQDGLHLLTRNNEVIPDRPSRNGDTDQALQVSDGILGEKAFNYQNAPFFRRLGLAPGVEISGTTGELSGVFSSKKHGDPDTPIFRAYEGDAVRYRIGHAGDKGLQHVFSQSGAVWLAEPNDAESRLIDTVGGIAPGRVENIEIPSFVNPTGDYRYGSPVAFGHLSGGLWGLMRIYPKPAGAAALMPTALPSGPGPENPDDPRAGGHPLLPLESDTVLVMAFDDANRNGKMDRGEDSIEGLTATILAGGTALTSKRIAENGSPLTVAKGTYTLRLQPPPGWRLTTTARPKVTTKGNNDRRVIRIGLRYVG